MAEGADAGEGEGGGGGDGRREGVDETAELYQRRRGGVGAGFGGRKGGGIGSRGDGDNETDGSVAGGASGDEGYGIRFMKPRSGQRVREAAEGPSEKWRDRREREWRTGDGGVGNGQKGEGGGPWR